jgi:F-type H+-transporting ATPase subunit gamma
MRRHELDKHRRKLGEIRDILASMKTLAAMETHKLTRFIEAQKQMSLSIADIAADFLCFHPGILPEAVPQFDVILIIGSERGFCGDFNDRIIEELNRQFTVQARKRAKLIIVGSKLHPLLDESTDQSIYIQGADIADEIVSVLDSLAEALATYRQVASFYVVNHGELPNEIVTAKLLPPFNEPPPKTCAYSTPPLLNMPPTDFLLELTDHYLFNSLHRILYLSLMAENQHRVQHLEHATRHLDDSTEELGRKINALRQEEIIEEIEVILLNAATDYR